MKRLSAVLSAILVVAVFAPPESAAIDSGLLRAVPVDTPERGIIWLANTSFYSPVKANAVLKNDYGVTGSDIVSNLTHISLGLGWNFALTGTIPYYADMFAQDTAKGKKTGSGDVSVGLRMSFAPRKTVFQGLSFGASASIPERFGYGQEPLGFRTFSSGEFMYGVDMGMKLGFRRVNTFFSTSYRQYPRATVNPAADTDIFYDSSIGLLGIGGVDADGFADGIFQDQLTFTLGAVTPVTSWLAGVAEVSSTSFTTGPSRNGIVRVAPGIRLGRSESVNITAGVDFGVSGQIADRTWVMRVNLPFLSPRAIGIPVGPRRIPENINRSRNALVGVSDFGKNDMTYLYEDELKQTFSTALDAMGVMNVIPDERVLKAYAQAALTPVVGNHERLGVRIGANYLINADIVDYYIERTSSFSIPYVISFPETIFSLNARASVTDLITGEVHDLGLITAQINKSRGFNLFPMGASSDIVYLSEPERRNHEHALVDRWVDEFNTVIRSNVDVFGWQPKRTAITGSEEDEG